MTNAGEFLRARWARRRLKINEIARLPGCANRIPQSSKPLCGISPDALVGIRQPFVGVSSQTAGGSIELPAFLWGDHNELG